MIFYRHPIISILALLSFSVLGFLVYQFSLSGIPFQEESYKSKQTWEAIIKEKQDNAVSILAFGDMMLDRAVRKRIQEEGSEYPFALIKDLFKGNDIVVANAEGVFTHFSSVTVDELERAPLQFTFDLAMISTLRELGFTHVSQANNHALDFGAEGLTESLKALREGGIAAFGDYFNQDPGPEMGTIDGRLIAFIAYNQFSGGGIASVVEAIQAARGQNAFVIIYPHWGEEYEEGITESQKDTAHQFIDAGADLILGSHPHVIEPIEIYKNKAIFYSLGNFIFDQQPRGPTAEGLAIRVLLAENLVSYELIPFAIIHAQASLMPEEKRNATLRDIAGRSTASDKIKDGISEGNFVLSLRE